MDMLIYVAKMLAKGLLIFIGGLMLFGGGACVLIGVGNVGRMDASLFTMVGIAIVVALIGWGFISAGRSIKASVSENQASANHAKSEEGIE
jgi:hypothetical protein